jgi:hypothetical protein
MVFSSRGMPSSRAHRVHEKELLPQAVKANTIPESIENGGLGGRNSYEQVNQFVI